MKTHIKTNSLSQIKFNLRCCTIFNKLFLNRQDACSTRRLTLCGTGILPVANNGAQDACSTRRLTLCGTGILPVANNGAISANNSATRFAIVVFLTLSSTIALPSCGAPPTSQGNQMTAGAPQAPPAAEAIRGEAADSKMAATPKQAKAETTATRPQLIKKAELSVVVKSIDVSTKSVTNIVEKQQGDILGFQNQKPPDSSIRQTATMEIRVPQERLETTLDTLAKLGTVENRGLTAEDVTTQLVDSEARLRNLRKSEEMVLKIMDKSGSVGDVLKAAKELSNIRQSIEQIDAQLKSLRNQVAYSTISLTLEAAVSSAQSPEPSLGLRVQETWGKATHSVGELTLGLFDLGIWLLAYTPYFLLIAAGIYGFNKFKKPHSIPKIEEPKSPH